MCACTRVPLRECERVCVRVRMRACACICVRMRDMRTLCLRANVCMYIYIYIYIYITPDSMFSFVTRGLLRGTVAIPG